MKEVVMAKGRHAVHMIKVVKVKGQPVVHTKEVVIVKDLHVKLMKDPQIAKAVTTANPQKKITRVVNPELQVPTGAYALTNSYQTREYARAAKQMN